MGGGQRPRRVTRGLWVLLAVSAVLIAVAAGALSVLHREGGRKTAGAARVPQPARPSGDISLTGTVRAQHVVSVAADVSGTVESFAADVGQEVFQGQVLARLTNQGLQTAHESAQTAAENARERVARLEAAILQARMEASRARADAARSRSEYDRTEKMYRRQKMLHSEGATPRLTYERSERDYEQAKGEFDSLDEVARHSEERVASLMQELQSAKKMLDDKNNDLEHAEAGLRAAEVVAPVNGTVVGRQGEAGDERQQGAELFRIATDLAQLEVVVEPEPPVLERLKPGLPAMIFLADVQGEGVPGRIREISGSDVVVEFTSPTPLVRPSMTAQVRLHLP